ncbi:uncharacterized protein LOC132696623 [Cylas formicarius]|uniref:uncharacterized protein LOC132696623 n=1 Tax=Cylas formicarius TaxID=197179 RepID=UPI00295876B0|nr:uncharacterized protein LOC132696623 [Cylas formicarius]XP_060517543.1 uncharacterized protein LOC132696623 [Cylas formicarius]XP_060517544.1 uncharacterized protein LOC132696623 [Cylas formicarius]
MKKICDKITKQQWRITVPNINSSMFRKSPSKDETSKSPDRGSKRSSGFYDLQEAQLEFDKARSLPTSIYIDSASSSCSEDGHYEDANESGIEKRSSKNDTDLEQFTDAEESLGSKNISKNNSQFEYDVPRISFKFFEKNTDENHYENEEEPVLIEHTAKGEFEIELETRGDLREEQIRCHPSEKFVSQTEILVRKSYEHLPVGMVKSGSDPNIVLRAQDEDEGFYKVPRSLQVKHRLSQSLNDFDPESEDVQKLNESNRSSIEHISCSQVIAVTSPNQLGDTSRDNPENLDYCKARSRLPLRIRRPTLLKKPNKAVDTWNHFRTRVSNMLSEQAAQQRVGAFSDREKLSINFEEMYKNSKTKCKKVFQNTGKMFVKSHGKKSSENSDADSSCNNSPSSGIRSDGFPFRPRLQASDIEYKLNISDQNEKHDVLSENEDNMANDIGSPDDKREEFDFSTIKSAFKKKLFIPEGQNGFEDLRRYVKQGGDFCKELATILQERADAETQYAKNLSKLSNKLSRACRDGVGGINEAWKAVANELENKAEAHRIVGTALLEETAKPLRNLTENQHRTRKQCEAAVEKAARLLGDWRAAEAKGKKHSHSCARDNEKLQDAAIIDTSKYGKQTLSKSTSLIHLAQRQNSVDKENAKLEGKKKKAEDAVKKADIEYYTLCVRAERARLEWESAVLRGVSTFQSLEEERLNHLKVALSSYLKHNAEFGPRLIEATERLKAPATHADPSRDLITFQNLRQTSQQVSEQLLPDFYCEHITLAMNRERRKQALVKLLHLIRQDIERERKSKNGLEKFSNAIKQTPSFGNEDSQQSVTEKMYHMKSMLTYLEGARYKVQSALAELDSRPRAGHPLAPHITITRDKSGLQQSVLKVPQWLREEFIETDRSPMSEKSLKSDHSDPHLNEADDGDWNDRGAADGNSNQLDSSDFDEFSSQCSSSGNPAEAENPVHPIARCRAIYAYTPNLPDELSLKPGDVLQVYRQQDDGWWLGECNGSVGIFPATYVEIVPS